MESKASVEGEKIPIKAVIFDLDGLLIDSEPVLNKAYLRLFEEKGIEEDPNALDEMGMGLKDIVADWKKRYSLKESEEELLAQYRACFYQVLFEDGLVLFDGAVELLERLRNKYVLALATGGHSREKTAEILERLQI